MIQPLPRRVIGCEEGNMDKAYLSFEGISQEFRGQYQRRTPWERVKAGLKTWAIFWGFALLFIFVPYVNISVFMIFIPLGPVSMAIVYWASKRMVQTIEGEATCPRCQKHFSIRETNVRPPIYEHCPHCRCNYEIILP